MIYRLAIMRSKSAGSHLIILCGYLGYCITKYKSASKRNDTVGEGEVMSTECVCVYTVYSVIEHSTYMFLQACGFLGLI